MAGFKPGAKVMVQYCRLQEPCVTAIANLLT